MIICKLASQSVCKKENKSISPNVHPYVYNVRANFQISNKSQKTEVLQLVSFTTHGRTAVFIVKVTLGDSKGMEELESLISYWVLEHDMEVSIKIFGNGGESLTELLPSEREHTSSWKHSLNRVDSRL